MLPIKINLRICLAALGMLLPLPSIANGPAYPRMSLEVGTGPNVRLLRLGVQAAWPKRWLQSDGYHLGGYWDATFAIWRNSVHRGMPGRHQNVVNLGLTPIFRYQANDLEGWFVEGGIGLNLLSDHYNNDGDQLSTKFQFGDQIGAGYVFNNKWELGLTIQHFSNGGVKRPNSGVNFLVIKASRPF